MYSEPANNPRGGWDPLYKTPLNVNLQPIIKMNVSQEGHLILSKPQGRQLTEIGNAISSTFLSISAAIIKVSQKTG
jgi:hypothetical protein